MAAWAVDIGIDRAKEITSAPTATEINGIARELADDYDVSDLQGHIGGAILLGLGGDCTSKQYDMNELVKENN
jgi:hypothetical protein